MNLAVAASPARSPDPSRTSRGPPPHSTGRPARIRPPALGSVQLLQCFPLSCKCHIQCFGLLYFVPRAWCPCIAGGVGLMGAACGSVAGGLTGERRKSRHLYNVFALPSFLVLRSGGGFKCVALDVFPHGPSTICCIFCVCVPCQFQLQGFGCLLARRSLPFPGSKQLWTVSPGWTLFFVSVCATRSSICWGSDSPIWRRATKFGLQVVS